MQQATLRNSDETICFRCGMTIKRDVGQCPNCGSPIAPGSQPLTPATGLQPVPAQFVSDDVAGPGRYILNLFLAGFIGLGLTYFLRRDGWLSTWISAAIFGLIMAVLIAAHS